MKPFGGLIDGPLQAVGTGDGMPDKEFHPSRAAICKPSIVGQTRLRAHLRVRRSENHGATVAPHCRGRGVGTG